MRSLRGIAGWTSYQAHELVAVVLFFLVLPTAATTAVLGLAELLGHTGAVSMNFGDSWRCDAPEEESSLDAKTVFVYLG